MVLISHNCLFTVRHSSPYMVITARTQGEKRTSERKRREEKQRTEKETVSGQNEEEKETGVWRRKKSCLESRKSVVLKS